MISPCSATVSLKWFVGDQFTMIFQYSLRRIYSPFGCVHFVKTQYSLRCFPSQDYLEAGSDIVETNTFNGTSVAQSDYGMEKMVSMTNMWLCGGTRSGYHGVLCGLQVYRINKKAAEIAKQACKDVSEATGI